MDCEFNEASPVESVPTSVSFPLSQLVLVQQGVVTKLVRGLSQEPQEPVHRRGLERLRGRLMESPRLGELLESLPEAVLFPHLHHQNPQGPQELAHRRVVEPPRVQE